MFNNYYNFAQFFSELNGTMLGNFANKNNYYRILRERIKEGKDNLKNTLDVAQWKELQKLIDLIDIKNEVEENFLYSQGILDCISILYYLNIGIINESFIFNERDNAKF